MSDQKECGFFVSASVRSPQWWFLLKPQMLACAIVAAWDYIHFRDLERFLMILALGQADISLLKPVLLRFLHSFIDSGPGSS